MHLIIPFFLFLFFLGVDVSNAAASFRTWLSAWNSCPQACAAFSGPDEWGLFGSLSQLAGCNETMLLNFALHNPNISPIRACTATGEQADLEAAVEKSFSQFQSTISYTEKQATLQVGWWGEKLDKVPDSTTSAIKQIHRHLKYSGEHIMHPVFSYSGNSIVGLYVGQHLLGIDVANKAVRKLSDHINKEGVAERTAIQFCGPNADHGVGIVVDTTGDLEGVKKIVQGWKEAICQTDFDGKSNPIKTTLRVKKGKNFSLGGLSNSSSLLSRRMTHGKRGHTHLNRRDTCETIQVADGDTCESLAEECGIKPADFTKYNSDKDLCSSLVAGNHVCCTAGDLPDMSPKPNDDGTCANVVVQAGDNCASLAAANDITKKEIETWNEDSWGWSGCDNLQTQQKICLSEGDPPMPAEVKNAVCGPQVSGTEKPTNVTKLADLNPCPLNACCNIWGQCGITSEFCTKSESSTGAPGTAKPGTNGCISNCGTEMVNDDEDPDEFISIGYFEAFNTERACLTMDIRDVDTSKYTHLHFAFAKITEDFDVDLSGVKDQFDGLLELRDIKRIVAFGGWSFSTDVDSYAIFRKGVTDANRHTFATNVVKMVKDNDLDGVDFDWEYPGAPDIPGIPAGDEGDGERYLEFLKEVREQLPEGKSLAIAAPASFWYLKGFPIANISDMVDYIVYMTYDLHGQWDYGNHWAVPDCPHEGACLRSHVNLTETDLSLAMVTKAGVPSKKIIAGVSSYGRSFEMKDKNCSGPDCTYTGPESGATPGKCTRTGGYISDAEINEIIKNNQSVETYYDQSSDSNILIYDETQWVANMDSDTKKSRTDYYKDKKLGGTSDWAVDLQEYLYGEDGGSNGGDGDGGGLLYIAPSIWQSDSLAVTCKPPCTLVMPPFPLETTSTVPWPASTTPLLSSKENGDIVTVTTTITVSPFPIESIPWWPVTIGTSDPTSTEIELVQSVMPPRRPC